MSASRIIDGINVRERPGPGPVVVLLHGIGSNGASFAGIMPLLPGDWRVIVWDAPGYGGSTPPPMDWPVAADYAAALARVLDALGVGRAYLVGHSLGALMAGAFARGYPDRVARLLLASPALGHGVAQCGTLSAQAQARIDDLSRLGPEAFATARAARLIHDAPAHPDLVEKVRAGMATVRPDGYAQAARMLASGNLADDLARITCPADVIVGAGDLVTPPESARTAHAAIPPALRGGLTTVSGAGHAIYHQAPGAFAAAIAAMHQPAPLEQTGETHG